jgi:U3 small nucleolar RNA-associated protein 3
MESLLHCRELWSKVINLKPSLDIEQEEDLITAEVDILDKAGDSALPSQDQEPASKKSKKQRARELAAAEALKARAERIRAAEEELQDLSSLIPKVKKSSKQPAVKSIVRAAESDSDFGEEESLSARALAEKASKKKSLRFYTSQIAQKANRRADAGRDAGGDADLPYRERLRDRQARLNAEAEKRGKKLDEYGRGTALGGDDSGDNDDDADVANAVRGEEDDYYDMVTQVSRKKKEDKAERYTAIAAAKAAGKQMRVVEGEVGEDGKRAIGYVIEKNKGLTPKRKKDVRNPRVKKRKKFEEKKKKLASIRAVYKGGEERGGYGGEKTGIKTNLVKSIKL